MTGTVFDIQRAALHDGPGLRTTVFLKGCPLRCLWCHNPESQHFTPETGVSGKTYGKIWTIEEIMKIVRADKHFYETSGGGVTISGGEPTAQFDFCLALLKAARAESIDTCLDTSGWFDSSQLETLLPWVNLWHYDYKATGHSVHRKLTGVDSDTILLNLETLLDKGASVALRCPIVPGVNDTRAHLDQIAAWRKSGRFFSVEELPYHKTGEPKYCDLGRGVPLC